MCQSWREGYFERTRPSSRKDDSSAWTIISESVWVETLMNSVRDYRISRSLYENSSDQLARSVVQLVARAFRSHGRGSYVLQERRGGHEKEVPGDRAAEV